MRGPPFVWGLLSFLVGVPGVGGTLRVVLDLSGVQALPDATAAHASFVAVVAASTLAAARFAGMRRFGAAATTLLLGRFVDTCVAADIPSEALAAAGTFAVGLLLALGGVAGNAWARGGTSDAATARRWRAAEPALLAAVVALAACASAWQWAVAHAPHPPSSSSYLLVPLGGPASAASVMWSLAAWRVDAKPSCKVGVAVLPVAAAMCAEAAAAAVARSATAAMLLRVVFAGGASLVGLVSLGAARPVGK